tara:strand:+ start:361 stop:552 length:192 start_codon:yes stop_codon:yes gene_type:complete
MTNKHNAPKSSEYTLDIIDKTINEIILTYKNKNINDLIEIMNDFPLNKYSRKLVGDEIYLWEA